MSPFERIRQRRLDEQLARLRPQVDAALKNLATRGIRARIVGSYAKGRFSTHSDVEFLIEDRGPASLGEVYEAIASELREASFDIVLQDGLDEKTAGPP
jgi:hypothetical protein